MITIEQALSAQLARMQLWYLATEQGGVVRVCGMTVNSVCDTGVHFVGGHYRSFGDIFSSEADAQKLIEQPINIR